jgi:hypothetical protein
MARNKWARCVRHPYLAYANNSKLQELRTGSLCAGCLPARGLTIPPRFENCCISQVTDRRKLTECEQIISGTHQGARQPAAIGGANRTRPPASKILSMTVAP